VHGPVFSHTRKLLVTPYVHTYRNVEPWQVSVNSSALSVDAP